MMPSEVTIHESPARPTREQAVEVVERKGTGHPDTICDAVGEAVSIALAQAYRDTFGRVLHHNIDKGLLVAGQVACRFGGGRVVEPMRLIIGDRASFGLGQRTVPVARIAVEAAQGWLRRHLRRVDPLRHVRYQVELRPTSTELASIFECRDAVLAANDTSAAVGYAPLTPTERLVLDVERFLNGPLFKGAFPDTGEDVKVMAVRLGRDLSVTVAMPLLARAIRSETAYFRRKAEILAALKRHVSRQPLAGRHMQMTLNALDRRGAGLEGIYVTLLGTSAEQGDSGQVGRGNRVNGVIALNRPMSVEAAAGKNPVSHVGKIYNVLAQQLAWSLHREVAGVREAVVWLSSRIGNRIDRPAFVTAQVALSRGASLARVRTEADRIIRQRLARMQSFCEELAKGQYPVC
jgi:S-adenosylmethionine synthetase